MVHIYCVLQCAVAACMHGYLERVPSFIVPECDSAIVTTTEQHIVLISAHSVYYRVVPSQIVQEHAISRLRRTQQRVNSHQAVVASRCIMSMI
jgi:hypothetical protein